MSEKSVGTVCVFHESFEGKLEDHEERIRVLEKVTVGIETKLNSTNKILGAIAVMIGGCIVSFLFALFTGQIKLGG